MRWLGIVLFSVSVSAATKMDESVVSKAKYPLISGVNGNVTIIGKEGVPRPAKLREILKERAIIETSGKAQIRIELDDRNGVILLENSKMEIPVIGFEYGEVSDVVLHSGQMRVQGLDNNERFYATAVTRDIYKEADFLLAYDVARAKTTLSVFQGNLQFRGLENEKSLQVASGESATFTGVIENGEPAFDILLKGRKVARGELQAQVKSISKNDLEVLQKETLVQKPLKPLGPIKPPRKPGQICDEPYAKLNECVWRCWGQKPSPKLKTCDVSKAGVTCLRQRCNANGQWSDNFVLPEGQNRCGLKPLVGPCDY